MNSTNSKCLTFNTEESVDDLNNEILLSDFEMPEFEISSYDLIKCKNDFKKYFDDLENEINQYYEELIADFEMPDFEIASYDDLQDEMIFYDLEMPDFEISSFDLIKCKNKFNKYYNQ